MNRIIATTTLLLLFTIFGCKKNVTENNLNNEITTYIKEQIQIQEIPGIAIAVIKDGNLIYEKHPFSCLFHYQVSCKYRYFSAH